jgi:hypothetical protein
LKNGVPPKFASVYDLLLFYLIPFGVVLFFLIVVVKVPWTDPVYKGLIPLAVLFGVFLGIYASIWKSVQKVLSEMNKYQAEYVAPLSKALKEVVTFLVPPIQTNYTKPKPEHADIYQAWLKYFGTNIRMYSQAQGSDEQLVSDVGPDHLWKYIMHMEGKGREMKEVYEKIEKMEDPKPNLDRLDTIRGKLFQMRKFAGTKRITQFSREVFVGASVVLCFLLFLIFHALYQDSASRATTVLGLSVLVLIMAVASVGWFSVALR